MKRYRSVIGCVFTLGLGLASVAQADLIGFDSGTIYAVTDRDGTTANDMMQTTGVSVPDSGAVTQTDAGLESTTLYTDSSDNYFHLLGYLTLDGLNANTVVASQTNLTFTPTEDLEYTFEAQFYLTDGVAAPFVQSWFDVSEQLPYSDLFNESVASGNSVSGVLQAGQTYQFVMYPNIEGSDSGSNSDYTVCYSLQVSSVPLPPTAWSSLALLAGAGVYFGIRRRQLNSPALVHCHTTDLG